MNKESKKSFSTEVKKEILNLKPENKKQALSELYGMLFSKNSLKAQNIYFKSELVYIASRVEENLEMVDELKYSISYIKSNKIANQKIYLIKIENQREKLEKLFQDLDDIWILKGYFISSGYIRDPKKAYSLDIFIENENSSLVLYDILEKMGVNVFVTNKKSKEIVYVRNRENILDILIKLDAVNAFFKYEDITIKKEMNLKISRSINYEIANETKKIKTANKQVEMIKKIDKKIGLNSLSDILYETANARIENEELSLQELADKLNISKSGLRNRFRKLEEIYEKIMNK
ncbi:DNA-binding protein WhiA [Oceanivirga miroungae]|uniref:Probable cell division protein WhiA n=1 Tax=Oceanivirga miroungae TaxID=1130046 RepID=A0A6I8M796_9FUSO|nr:DNA-binding protein WhiA [Oceanivirga miroungae]VWL85744.1 putative sporulation transcription regulator WhiA [Oceanivirga miroungae]